MDLGATGLTTFRLVTFPLMRSRSLAGALLAFGLSFDEIIVTMFTRRPGVQTLPIWIFKNLFRPNQAPIVNAVAAALVLVASCRSTSRSGFLRRRARPAADLASVPALGRQRCAHARG